MFLVPQNAGNGIYTFKIFRGGMPPHPPQVRVSFIRQYTQLVPGIFKATCVSYMETVGIFDLHAVHVRYGLKLEFKHDIILYIFINHLLFL